MSKPVFAVFALAATGLAAADPAPAADGGASGRIGERMAEWVTCLSTELSLGTEVTASLNTMLDEFEVEVEPLLDDVKRTKAELKALEADGDTDGALAKKGELKALQDRKHALKDEFMVDLKEVLTEEQIAQAKEPCPAPSFKKKKKEAGKKK